jgi:hypothetical protein
MASKKPYDWPYASWKSSSPSRVVLGVVLLLPAELMEEDVVDAMITDDEDAAGEITA